MPRRSDRSDHARLLAAPRAGERPGERVVAEDRGSCGARGTRRATSVAGRMRWSASKTADSTSLRTPFAASSQSMTPTVATCLAGAAVPGTLVEIREQRDELRQRHRIRRALREGDRAREVSARRLEACELLRRQHVAGQQLERIAARARRVGRDPPGDPASRARRWPRRRARAGRTPRRPRAASPPARRAGRRAARARSDPRVRGDARPERDHALEGAERRGRASSAVADQAVGARFEGAAAARRPMASAARSRVGSARASRDP